MKTMSSFVLIIFSQIYLANDNEMQIHFERVSSVPRTEEGEVFRSLASVNGRVGRTAVFRDEMGLTRLVD